MALITLRRTRNRKHELRFVEAVGAAVGAGEVVVQLET